MSLSNSYSNLRPTLLLDFSNGQALDPRITFARASTARFYDGETVAKAEENLLTQSNPVTGTNWSNSGFTITTNAGVAPDGTSTATKLVPVTDNVAHSTFQVATAAGSNVQSVFVKADGYTKVALRESQTGAYYVSFDLTGSGSVIEQSSATGTITALANSWFRISMVGSITGTTRWSIYVLAPAYTTGQPAAFAGDGTSGVLVWGAQLENRTAVAAYTPTTTAPVTNYVPQLMTAASGQPRIDFDPITRVCRGLLIEESRQNLLQRSEEFDNAAWTKSAASAQANATVAPDGALTADALVEDTTTAEHWVQQASTVVTATAYTYSLYAKAAGRTKFRMREVGATNATVVLDLTTGTVSSTSGGGTGTITNVGNGWYRCTLTFTSSGTTAALRVNLLDESFNASYAGNGYSGVFIWGAQLE